MNCNIDHARLVLTLKTAQAYSFFLGIAFGQDREVPESGRTWTSDTAACANVAYEGAVELLHLCDWAKQPRMMRAIEEHVQSKYCYPFTEPEVTTAGDAADLLGETAERLAAAVQIDALTDQDFATFVCCVQVLAAMWAATDSWDHENLVDVVEESFYFPDAVWLRSAGVDHAPSYRNLFSLCPRSRVDRLFDPGFTSTGHGFDMARLLVVRRFRARGVERELRAEIEAILHRE